MVADSERNADMLYAVRTFVRDPVIWFVHKGAPSLVVQDAEVARLKAEAQNCRVLPRSRYERRLGTTRPPGIGELIGLVLAEHRIRKVTVAEDFPLGLAKLLRSAGIKVKLKTGAFFPDRASKSSDEVKKINAALVMAEVGLAEGLHALRKARPGKANRLMINQSPLTAERLRAIIESSILHAGGQACRTVVAGGRQSSNPHERGHGPLRANEPIVIELSPRSQRTGYYGDVTRTVVRGRASEFVRRMYLAVEEAQNEAAKLARCGTRSGEVHRETASVLLANGFKTTRRNGRHEGFLHSAGHGIGLECHESPRLSPESHELLRAGNVLTLEPGLYYAEVGGVRLEDVVLVTRGAPRTLTKFEKQLEI